MSLMNQRNTVDHPVVEDARMDVDRRGCRATYFCLIHRATRQHDRGAPRDPVPVTNSLGILLETVEILGIEV